MSNYLLPLALFWLPLAALCLRSRGLRAKQQPQRLYDRKKYNYREGEWR